MSPLATWETSWPSTASASSGRMRCSRPVLTATKALLRDIPVANALGSGLSKIPTSGMPIPESRAMRATVSTSQRSKALPGCSITRTPMKRLAIHLDIAKEMKEPPIPMMAAKTSSATGFPPRTETA